MINSISTEQFNAAQKLIYTVSNIRRTSKTFDDSDIAGIYLTDDSCIVVNSEGQEQSFSRKEIQETYVKHTTRETSFFRNLGPNYIGPKLWRGSLPQAYVMLRGANYWHTESHKTSLAKSQILFLKQDLDLIESYDSLETILENEQLNLGHLIQPDIPYCSCGSFQKQSAHLELFQQELSKDFQPSCIHLVWYQMYKRFLINRSKLLTECNTGYPKKCAGWWYAPPNQKNPNDKGTLKILYTDKGFLAPLKDWKVYKNKELFNQYDMWNKLFNMVDSGYVPYCGVTALSHLKYKDEKSID